jgi:hypothetical protein
MVHADDVRASIKVCMFDQYGTVVDMQTGLTEAAAPFLAAKGWHGDPNSFVTWWRRTHFENSMIDALLHREHTSYREVGHRSVAFVLERAGIPYTLDRRLFQLHMGNRCLRQTTPAITKAVPKRTKVLGSGTAQLFQPNPHISRISVVLTDAPGKT